MASRVILDEQNNQSYMVNQFTWINSNSFAHHIERNKLPQNSHRKHLSISFVQFLYLTAMEKQSLSSYVEMCLLECRFDNIVHSVSTHF